MPDDITARLRQEAPKPTVNATARDLMIEAAAEIDRLRGRKAPVAAPDKTIYGHWVITDDDSTVVASIEIYYRPDSAAFAQAESALMSRVPRNRYAVEWVPADA